MWQESQLKRSQVTPTVQRGGYKWGSILQVSTTRIQYTVQRGGKWGGSETKSGKNYSAQWKTSLLSMITLFASILVKNAQCQGLSECEFFMHLCVKVTKELFLKRAQVTTSCPIFLQLCFKRSAFEKISSDKFAPRKASSLNSFVQDYSIENGHKVIFLEVVGSSPPTEMTLGNFHCCGVTWESTQASLAWTVGTIV